MKVHQTLSERENNQKRSTSVKMGFRRISPDSPRQEHVHT